MCLESIPQLPPVVESKSSLDDDSRARSSSSFKGLSFEIERTFPLQQTIETVTGTHAQGVIRDVGRRDRARSKKNFLAKSKIAKSRKRKKRKREAWKTSKTKIGIKIAEILSHHLEPPRAWQKKDSHCGVGKPQLYLSHLAVLACPRQQQHMCVHHKASMDNDFQDTKLLTGETAWP